MRWEGAGTSLRPWHKKSPQLSELGVDPLV
jgi:hypothetical protein